MNNCDNTVGGSSSEIKQNLPSTPTTTTIVSSSTTTSTVSISTWTNYSSTTATTATTIVDNNKLQETFYTFNKNLINNSTPTKVEQQPEENGTKCAGNTTNKVEETTPAAVVVANVSEVTADAAATNAVSSVSYAAITAMDTAAANAFISTCCKGNNFEIQYSPNCYTNKTKTKNICDNELIIKQPAVTSIPAVASPSKASMPATTPFSGESSSVIALEQNVHTGIVDETKFTSNIESEAESTPSVTKNLEKEESTTTTRLPDVDSKTLNSSMLLRKKVHVLPTTSSEPILNQSGSGSGHKTEKQSEYVLVPLHDTYIKLSRRVSFPKSDDALVTGYLEPANPWEHVFKNNTISEIAELYTQSCQKHKTCPIPSVLDHLKAIELNTANRQPILSLKSIKLEPADCEALEEIFKRVQYKSIDVSSCELNGAAVSALFDMFEYYESTNELDISSNLEGMVSRGWTSCFYMLSHSRALQVLNLSGNTLLYKYAETLGNALNSSNLHTIKLEHCGLREIMAPICTKLSNNKILRELWLAHNDLTCIDAEYIGQLLRANHYLQLIDISNNDIKDIGLKLIIAALIEQSAALQRRQEAAAEALREWKAALGEAEYKKRQQLLHKSTNNVTNSSTTISTNGSGTSTDEDITSGDSDVSPAEEEEDDDDDDDDDDDEADDADVDTDANDAEEDDATTTDDCEGSKVVKDDDEDTVKPTTMKPTPPINGQSKLDKLLSMNNSDSSEDVPTDTIAASDISVSDDIFDSTKGVTVLTSSPIVEPAIEQQERPIQNNNNNNTPVAATTFEVSDMIEETMAETATIVTASKALDMNKNTTTKIDDFDDTHSTDSAFESSSDGDTSRHLPDEFVSRFDGKDDVETATIATEALTTPTPTPPPVFEMPRPPPPPTMTMTTAMTTTLAKPIEVSCNLLATSASPNTSCDSSSGDISALKNAALAGTSPSPASGMRRTESTCTITQSTRVRSHSSDSLSSDNSVDGSLGDGNFSTKINEKLTKNDTLTRQKQFDVPQDSFNTPHGLKALALWNNKLTKESGPVIANLLATTVSLELLNIGQNILSNDFVATIRDSLSQNTTLTSLGLQSAHLSCAGIRTLSSILQFGGNSTLQRIDIRNNKIEVESLNMLAEALKSNTSVTQIDIDDEPKRLSIGSDAQLDYSRVLQNVRSLCSRNENQPAATATSDKTTPVAAKKGPSGYYLGSRKISLTCHTAPPRAIIDQANSSSTTPNSSKLEVNKKTGVRLRSPIPSPPTISPSSSPVPSPSKSRFQVFRVTEVSPLTSPMSPSPSPSPSLSPTPICTAKDVTGVLINSKDSTTTIKRLSTSPRSRFQVMKIYEDPGVPIANRTLPPITPSPSPPTAPCITSAAPPLMKSSPPTRAWGEPKIVTTPATPPLEEGGAEVPSFPVATTTTANAIETTNTKTNPNPLIVNNSTNTVKPNDQVDATIAPSPMVPQEKIEKEELVPLPALVVEEDQRTLTNCSVNSCLIDPIAVTTCSCAQELTTTQSTSSSATHQTQETDEPHESADPQEPLPQPTARARKVSWIQNSTYPGTVDRLLSIFQFQRSSSPETTLPLSSSEADQQTLVPVRKRSPPSGTQLPSWCKLGTEICKPVTTVIQTAAAVSSGHVACGPTTAVVASSAVEGPLSFLDAASKQLRDFSKHVFRQNIAFGNEATNISTLNSELSPQQLRHDCDTIPSDVKLEIKENISPEHTINEEHLSTLQKIGGSPGSSSTSSSGTDTTDGASSTSSSPSSLLSAPLIGPPDALEVLAGVASATAQSPHPTEEESCTS